MSALRDIDPGSAEGSVPAKDFLAMIEDRPESERWQLIEGRPFAMMTPPTLAHQQIALNCATLLNLALFQTVRDVSALIEVGLMIEGRDDFRPIADFAVVRTPVEDASYARHFLLAGEILSRSNIREEINAKRAFYSSAPSCLHVLILHQATMAAEVRSRANDWRGRIFRVPDDLIELPDFGFSCRLGDLYRGTSVA